MRTIKFRGKRLDNGEWVYGFYIENPDIPAGQNEREVLISDGYECMPVIPATVGQFTGLLDKNGRDIYEGDVVLERQYSGDDKWMIRYDVSLSEYRAENPEDECDDISLNLLSTAHIEVIGNIHDTPELLNSKQS